MDGEIRFSVKTRKYDCLYFCPHFCKAYKGKINVKKISFATVKKGASFFCDYCLKEQIENYVSFDNGQQAFFDEVKKKFNSILTSSKRRQLYNFV